MSPFEIFALAVPAFGIRALMLAGALALDAAFGEPAWLWRRVSHPVVAIGALITRLEIALNQPDEERRTPRNNRIAGLSALLVLLAATGAAAFAIGTATSFSPLLIILQTILVAMLLATRSLHDHVTAVAQALRSEGLPAARCAVSMIVGRNPEHLDEHAVARAAIESAAENYADGVIAPAFWFLIAGLPGIVLYKAINTADSMIGHKTARHRTFGWASARLDDLVNLIPARLTGRLLISATVISGHDTDAARRTMRRDARKHTSPNAGWPEAATAGALGIALAGPRRYAEHTTDDDWLNAEGRKEATPEDIDAALRLIWIATICVAVPSGLVGIISF
ncbi:MAG: adenosylcobinamide-phosphate synthase CbiB, partial [Pseudomonadota bacterium]